MKKGTPKMDGSGQGRRANMGRGGCEHPQEIGKGRLGRGRGFGRGMGRRRGNA